MNLTHQERELVWLTKKVKVDEDLIERAEAYFDEHQHLWSRGVLYSFLNLLERKKDQLYYEQHQLEMLAWRIVENRENNQTQ